MKLLISLHILVGMVLFAVPNMTRPEILFAVPVPRDFRQSAAGRHAIAMFRLVVAAVVLVGIAALLVAPSHLVDAVDPVVMTLTVICAGAAFYWQYRSLRPLAVVVAGKRTAALTTGPDRLPWFAWLGAFPFVVIGAAALYLYLNWQLIPERFPVHWGSSGVPNRWAERTAKGVYGVLLFATELTVMFLIMALCCWYGARRSNSRPVMLGGMIAMESILGCLFAATALQPVFRFPAWTIIAGLVAALVPLIIWMMKKMTEPSESLDPTPQECWKGGIFYYNPNDAALMVEKRDGLGYTFNFANRWSWILLAGLALVIISAPFVIG